MSIGVMLFNPFTGKPHHPEDIASDPRGILVWDGEEPLKVSPPQCTLIGLTNEEIKALPQWFPSHETAAVMPLIRAIETKLKEKDHG